MTFVIIGKKCPHVPRVLTTVHGVRAINSGTGENYKYLLTYFRELSETSLVTSYK